MGYCLYRPQPFEAGPGAESVRSVADSCWSRIKGRDKVELKLGCGNYDPQTPPSTLDSISLKDYPDRLLVGGQIDIMMDTPAVSMSQIRAGNIKAFAVTAKNRNALAPYVPTTDEAGLPGF